MKKTFSFLALALLMATCMPDESFIKTWRIEKLEAVSEEDTLSRTLYQDAWLSFYPDGKLSFYQKFYGMPGKHPVYFTGTWKEYGSGLSVSIDSLDLHEKFELAEVDSRDLELVVSGASVLKGVSLSCLKDEHFKTDGFDLLDPANNTWRKKPDHKESTAEIHARVLGHVQYLIAYFKLIQDKDQDYIETAHLQTPVRLHNNGLSLQKKFEKGYKWKSCYFDQEDAYAGGKLLKKSMMSIEKYPEDKKSLVVGYHDALVMMKEYLQENLKE